MDVGQKTIFFESEMWGGSRVKCKFLFFKLFHQKLAIYIDHLSNADSHQNIKGRSWIFISFSMRKEGKLCCWNADWVFFFMLALKLLKKIFLIFINFPSYTLLIVQDKSSRRRIFLKYLFFFSRRVNFMDKSRRDFPQNTQVKSRGRLKDICS